jgi:hypothetical protein
MAQKHPTAALADDIQRAFEKVRSAHALRALTDDESGTGVDKLPNGVYGFTYSPAIENFPLFAERDLRSYEGHKRADGTVVLLGYLSAQEKDAFEAASEKATIHLFPEPKGEATELVTVPMTRVLGHVEYSQRTGNGLELAIGP